MPRGPLHHLEDALNEGKGNILVTVVAHGVDPDDLAPFPTQRQFQRVGVVPGAGLWRDMAQRQPLRGNLIKP